MRKLSLYSDLASHSEDPFIPIWYTGTTGVVQNPDALAIPDFESENTAVKEVEDCLPTSGGMTKPKVLLLQFKL